MLAQLLFKMQYHHIYLNSNRRKYCTETEVSESIKHLKINLKYVAHNLFHVTLPEIKFAVFPVTF